MVHTKPAAEFVIKYRDIFNMKAFYRMLHEYLWEERYYQPDQAGHEFIETLYLERFLQKGIHAGGKEIWIYWRTYKTPESKYSAYIRYALNIDMNFVYVKDQEVMHQGKKIKVQWGEIHIFIKSNVEFDYQGKWRDHWMLKHLQHIYDERILGQETTKRVKEAWRDAYRIQNRIKQFLSMRQFLEMPEPFHPVQYGMEG